MSTVFTKSYESPPISQGEVLRYARAKKGDESLSPLLDSVLKEASPHIKPMVCYTCLDLQIKDSVCDFGYFSVKSESLAKNLFECKSAILFAATVGIGLDRLILKYSSISPSRALMLQAFGTERVEAISDLFSCEMRALYGRTKNRFSVGYGDAPLEVQRDIFALLDPPRRVGISLNESLLMSPTKSVTAFIGIEK